MAADLVLDPRHTAVLALDCQAGLVSIYATPPEPFVERAAGVLAAARTAGIQVIHVQVGFRAGLPEVSGRNRLFATIKGLAQHQRLFEGLLGAIHPALGPAAGDLVVVKHRVSAFTGTDLRMLLEAADIHTLVLFGIATSGVVLSTLLEACDRDYALVVVSDCCADLDRGLHDALIERLFPARGTVVTSDVFRLACAPQTTPGPAEG